MRKGFSSWNMRNILVLCCVFLLSFCVAIPFVSPVNSAKLVAIGNESPHMDTPHPAVGSLRDVDSNMYDVLDKRALLHDARDCFFSTNAQDDTENNGKLGQRTHKLTNHCVNTSFKRRTLSRRHNGSVRKGHKGKAYTAGTSSKSAVVDANGAHWFQQAQYRRSPELDLLGGIEHPRRSSTSTEGPHTEPTQAPPTSSHHTEEMPKRPTSSQGSDGSHPDEWGAYGDWKQ